MWYNKPIIQGGRHDRIRHRSRRTKAQQAYEVASLAAKEAMENAKKVKAEGDAEAFRQAALVRAGTRRPQVRILSPRLPYSGHTIFNIYMRV